MLFLIKTEQFCLEILSISVRQFENNYTAYGAAVSDELSFQVCLKWALENNESTQNSS